MTPEVWPQAWHLDDSEERGVGHIGGLAFRRWGDMAGSGPVEPLKHRVQPLPEGNSFSSKADEALAQTVRRAHPLFTPMVLRFLQARARCCLHCA
jgi:hypothetical protein